VAEESADDASDVRDANGNTLADGDNVTVIKDLALRRRVWNSPPELSQNIAPTSTGGMTWTVPRF
jgi:hypothetical protein